MSGLKHWTKYRNTEIFEKGRKKELIIGGIKTITIGHYENIISMSRRIHEFIGKHQDKINGDECNCNCIVKCNGCKS